MTNKIDKDIIGTVKSMVIGSVFYNFLVFVGVIAFSIIYKGDTIYLLKNIIAVVIGTFMCILGIYSLYKSVVHVIDIGSEKQARAKMIINYIIRIIVFSIVLIVIMKFLGMTSGIIYVISVFGIKVGAYLAPVIKNKI